jgi:hypothetical protein
MEFLFKLFDPINWEILQSLEENIRLMVFTVTTTLGP